VSGKGDLEALSAMRFRLEKPNLATIEVLKYYNQTVGIDVDVRVTPINRDIIGHSERMMVGFGLQDFERELPENTYFSEQTFSFDTSLSLGNLTTNAFFADKTQDIKIAGTGLNILSTVDAFCKLNLDDYSLDLPASINSTD
jgi:hypothetical protein